MNEKSIRDVVEEKLAADAEFQDSIKDLSDEDRSSTIESKRQEILNAEFKTLAEKAALLEKKEEEAKGQKARAEKAEGELKKLKPTEKKSEENNLSMRDAIVLAKADIPEEDIDEVTDYARFKGITIAEALKSGVVKATLSEKAEARKTAQATQVRQTRPQNTKSDGHTILQNAKEKGEDAIPSGGTAEAEAMFWARRGRKPE